MVQNFVEYALDFTPGKEGRAGWSWYTGAAGWYLRLLRELYGETP